MTHEQSPQWKTVETPDDYHKIAKATLAAIGRNNSGALGGDIIDEVQVEVGYAPHFVAAVFQEFAEQGVVERSLADLKIGVVLTERGQTLFQCYDRLMGLQEQ